jgi:hypothetical protein
MPRLKQYSRKKSCYYCGTPAPSSAEHAPPRMMFEAFDCDRITVPACEEHNNSKSEKDRAIVTTLIRGVDQMQSGGLLRTALSPNVAKALSILEPDFRQANRELTLQHYLIDPPKDLEIDLPYLKPEVRIRTWVVQLTAALVWSVVGAYDPDSDWQNAWSWSPHYVQTAGPVSFEDAAHTALKGKLVENKVEHLSAWWPGWSAKPRVYPPDIYNFKICLVPNPEDWDGKEVIFKHLFYGSTMWYVWFSTSQNTKDTLKDMLEAGK